MRQRRQNEGLSVGRPPHARAKRLTLCVFVLGDAAMIARRRPDDDPYAAPTMHRWTARHYVLSAIIILLAVGAFAYSWS